VADHPKKPSAPRKPREVRALDSELGPYWGASDRPSRSRQHVSSDDLLTGDSSTFDEVKTFKRPAVAPINFSHSPQYPGGWPHSAEKLAEANLLFTMPPKQSRQPEVSADSAPDTQQRPDWLADVLRELRQIKTDVTTTIETTVIPRLEALEAAKSRPVSPVRSSRSASPSVFAQPSQAPQSFAQPSQAPQSYVQPSQAPQSYVPQSVGSADFQRQRQYGDTHKKPRFRPESLPAVRFGDDVATWVAVMDHIILQHGEEIVCPEIFAHCFQSGDAMQLWYMDNDSLWKTVVTTKPGCWSPLKAFIEQRFSVDVGLRQIEAEDRTRYPHESYADFAIQKIFLIRRAFEHLAPSAIIAMVKRKLDWDAAQFCRERKDINDFISELMEFDNLRAMQATRQPPSTGAQRGQMQPYGHQSYAPQSYTPQDSASGPRDYEQKLEQRRHPFERDYRDESARVPPTQSQPQQPAAPYRQTTGAQASPATGSNAVYVDPRLSTIQPRKHPHTGIETLSYLDRSGKAVFLQRPCGHCEAMGKRNAWHFDFSCANQSAKGRRDRAYAGDAALPGTVESPSGHPTSYTFSGFANDPGPDKNPFSIDDVYGESGNGEGDQ
jgi:hypothetical protein